MDRHDVANLYSVEAERAVLGGILLSPDEFESVAEQVQASDFRGPENRKAFEVMAEIAESGEAPEIGLTADRLDQIDPDGDWWTRLAILMKNTASSQNVVKYAAKVREYAKLREMYQSTMDIQRVLTDGAVAIEDRIASAQTGLLEMDREGKGGPVMARDALKDYYDHVERCFKAGDGITGLVTGMENFDTRFGGLQDSQFVVLAARPSMGKTAMGLNIARHVAVAEKQPVLYFSLEMAKEELFGRLVSDFGNIPYKNAKSAQLYDGDMDYWPRFNAAFRAIHESQLIIDDQAGTTISEIIARAKRVHRKHDLKLIVIDHLHLIQSEGESETHKTSNISRALKRLAKMLSIPVIALCQLNRSCEQRPDKRPIMSDLRQSGAIEEDADLIGFIYRDVVYNPDTVYPYMAEVIWRKTRNAETGTDWFNAQLQYQRFVPCDEPAQVVEFQTQATKSGTKS